ncbi:MAG: MarR family transcriptional regulator [Pelomonas sp.]|nr:MarR family transcriptional regulator [Roseateles sp.]
MTPDAQSTAATGLDPDAAALAAELRGLVGKLRRRFREASGDGDLTNSQIATLVRLERDGAATVSALARAEGMRPQSMSAVIAPLLDRGLLVGAPDPRDGRQTLISLTERCRQWIADGRAARQDWLTRTVQAQLSPAERAQVAAALPLLRRLVGESDAPAAEPAAPTRTPA